jgi:hypothetical protein
MRWECVEISTCRADLGIALIDLGSRGTCFCVARPPPNIGEHRKGSMLAWTLGARIELAALSGRCREECLP